MKKENMITIKKAAFVLLPLFLLSLLFLPSCQEKDPDPGDPYFMIEGNPTGLTVDRGTKTQAYVVRSNRHWEIVKKGDADWLKIFPEKGDDDGIFKIIVEENPTFDPRTENLAFLVDGVEQPVLFRVDQEGNIPYITLPEGVTIPSAGGDFFVEVASNVEWSYTLSDPSWLTEASVTSEKITFVAGENTSADPRMVTLTLTGTKYPAATASVVLTQSPGSVLLEEDFNWLTYGNVVFYTTTGETRYDNWTQAERDRGWTSSLNTFSKDIPLYARPGCVKLGKTTYGGDLISPPLSKINGTQDLLVTFKAVPYMTKAGTKDDNILNISLIGPGTISQSQFIIDNWPVYPADDATHTDYCLGMWSAPEATRTFTITGATAETQIKFLGYDYNLSGVGAGKNRIFLDDIKVELKP